MLSWGHQARRCFTEDMRRRFLESVSSGLPAHARVPAPSAAGPSPTSAVLIPLVRTAEYGDAILFTKRSIHLKAHRGEVCFPGGRIDPGETVEQTALRETFEEIGIRERDVHMWGRGRDVLNRQLTATITPVVGQIDEHRCRHVAVNYEEVQTVFAVPISELVASTEYTHFVEKRMQYRLPVFRSSKFIVYANAEYSQIPREYHIWGLSAIMLHQFLSILEPKKYQNQLTFRVTR